MRRGAGAGREQLPQQKGRGNPDWEKNIGTLHQPRTREQAHNLHRMPLCPGIVSSREFRKVAETASNEAPEIRQEGLFSPAVAGEHIPIRTFLFFA